MPLFKIMVEVRPLVRREDLHRLDTDVDGEYRYTVEADTLEAACEIALDTFHDDEPIKILDDFEITAKEDKGDDQCD